MQEDFLDDPFASEFKGLNESAIEGAREEEAQTELDMESMQKGIDNKNKDAHTASLLEEKDKKIKELQNLYNALLKQLEELKKN